MKALGAAEAGAKRQAKSSKSGKQTGKYAPGLEWEVVLADTIILNGATNVLRSVNAVITFTHLPLNPDNSARPTWDIFNACEQIRPSIDKLAKINDLDYVRYALNR